MAWFKHVSDAVYDAVASAMGLDPQAQSTLDRILPAYVPGATTPQHNSNDDVIFFAISEDETAQSGRYMTITGEPNVLKAREVIPVHLLLIFYGPNADDDANRCRLRLMVDYGEGSPRAILRAARIVFNYGPGIMLPRPVSVPEVEGTLWRRRCDLRLALSYLNTEVVDMTPLEEAPDVLLSVPDVGINVAE